MATNKQNVNPSFHFTWDSQKQTQGRVFAKKRKPPPDSAKMGPTKKSETDTTQNNNKQKDYNFFNKYNDKGNLEKRQNNNAEKTQNSFNNDKPKDYNFLNKGNSQKKQKNFQNNNDVQMKNDRNTNKTDDLQTETDSFQRRDDDFQQDTVEGPKGYVKRKGKKDKLLAKQLAQEGRQSEVVSTQNSQKNYSLFNVIPKELYANTSAGKSVSEQVFIGGSFKDLDIHRHLVSNLEKIGFPKLTNVQKKAIPVVMSGKSTLIRSQTGSGKTLAYAVPIIDALQGINPRLKRGDGVQAIIVVPTRELALQTHELFSKINTFQWVVVGHLCGGENRKSEKERIRKGLNVLIGTPGRLLDHILHTTALKVDKVRCLVLDEADRLLDMGFRKDIISLVEALDRPKSDSDYDPMAMLKQNQISSPEQSDDGDDDPNQAPLKNVNCKERQTILLSATLNKGVSELAEFTMKEHTYIDALDQTAKETPEGFVIPSTVKQEFVLTYVKHRLFTLSALIVALSKKQTSKIFVFMASTQMVEYHYELFTNYLINMPVNRGKSKIGNVALVQDESDSEEEEEEVALDIDFFKLHGNMDQKMRKEVFNSFRSASKGVLICTDVAARGLDVPEADCIIQYTGPQSDEDYLHRVGRTGRAGKSGSAIIFLTHEEQEYINRLRELKVFLKQRNTDEFLQHLCDLMEEPEPETAATALQRRYETALGKDKDLHKAACFAYSTWSRFYSSYPVKMKEYFNLKNVNLGHYVTSFGLKETPSTVSKVVRGEVVNVETPRLNKKLANHKSNDAVNSSPQKKKSKRSVSLMMSEFASGMEPSKKKKKKKTFED